MRKISSIIKNSSFYEVFNFQDELAKGRVCIITSGILATIYNTLITGVFYTTFLLECGIDMVNIGMLNFIPFITSFASLLSPIVLSKFKNQKRLLFITRLIFQTINICGITIIPALDLTMTQTYLILGGIIFTSNVINFLFAPAYSVWHFNFLPKDIRMKFYSFQQILNGLMMAVTMFISGVVADAVSQSGNQLGVILALRYVAYAIAIVEIVILMIPREFDRVDHSDKNSLLSTFTKPLKHKKFALTMFIIFSWNLVTWLSLSAVDVYVIDELKISFTTINTMNALYVFFIIALTPFWRKFLSKYSWFITFAIGVILIVPAWFLVTFYSHETKSWLFIMTRLFQHLCGVGLTLAFANMAYVNMPTQDQTSCMSFHLIVSNIGALFGQLIGTVIVSSTKNIAFNLFGINSIPINNVKLAVWVQCITALSLGLFIFKNFKKLEPDKD